VSTKASAYSSEVQQRTLIYRRPTWQPQPSQQRETPRDAAMQVFWDEEAARAKAWDMHGIDDPLMRAAGRDDAGQMPSGLMSADRL
jgi:hypothetical protein